MKFRLLSVLLAFGALCFMSCSSNLSPRDYADYISRFSPKVISKSDPVWIELATPLDSVKPMAPIDPSLIRISPSVKGSCYWRNDRVVEFRPDPGEFIPGEKYKVTFELGKVMEVSDKKLRKFTMEVEIRPLNSELSLTDYNFSTQSADANTYTGEVALSDQVNIQEIEKSLKAVQDGKKLPVTLEGTTDPTRFKFTVSKISRGASRNNLSVTLRGTEFGCGEDSHVSEVIPTREDFSVFKAGVITEPVQMVELIYTDQLDPGQDLRGFVVVNNGAVSITNIKIDGNKVRLSGDFPSTGEVTVITTRPVLSRSGKKSQTAQTFTLSFAFQEPLLKIVRSGNIMPDSMELYLPIETRNLKAVTVIVTQIFENNIPYFLQDNKLDRSYRVVNYGREVMRQRINLAVGAADRNVTKVVTLELSKMFARSPGSIYRIELSAQRRDAITSCTFSEQEDQSPQQDAADEEDYYYEGDDQEGYYYYNWEDRNDPCKDGFYLKEEMRPYITLYSSNIGLVAKGNTSGSELTVIANNILNTEPIEGCVISVFDYQNQPIGGGSTDAQGCVTIACPDQQPFLVLASNGEERGFVVVQDGNQLSTSRFDIGGQEVTNGLRGFVYGERGVWRPGDRIFLTFVLDDSEQPLPAEHPVVLKLFNPQGRFVSKQVAASGLNGFYRFDLETSPEAPTGLWRAEISVGGATFTKALRVETVKPNRLKINLSIDKSGNKPLSEKINADLNVNWLQGAVGANLAAKVSVKFKPAQTAFKDYPNFEFNSSVNTFEPREVEIFNAKLNAEGKARIAYNVGKMNNAPGMLTAELITTATEPGGDFSTYIQSEPYSPYAGYVGIATPAGRRQEVLETDKKHRLEFVTVDPSGNARGAENILLRIYRIDWRWWWNSNREDLSYYVSNSNAQCIVEQTIKTNSSGKANYDLQIDYPDWGRYLVVATDLNSGHRSSQTILVDWPSWRGASSQKDPDGLTMLSFSTDKTEYEVGQKVKITIPKSSEGTAIISLEGAAKVLKFWRVRTHADKNTEASFEVTPEMAPNIYINITLLQPFNNTDNDLPIRLYGIKNINVLNPQSLLKPQIKMPEVLKPQKPFTVTVKEEHGKQMTYTLAIVDEGLLDLTAFRTPDPWSEFFARRAHGVKTWDMYDNIMGRYSGSLGALYAIGGSDESLNSAKQTNRFVPIVKYMGPFALKAGSQKSHTITLPQYVGSVRVMVVAGDKGAFGSTEKTVPVRNPLMTLTTLPRVLGPGEEVVLPVNVFSMEAGIRNAKISIVCSDLLQIVSQSSVAVNFGKSGEALAGFRLRVKNAVGQASVTITATSGNQTSTETIQIGVRNPNPELIAQQRCALEPGAKATLDYNLGQATSEDWLRLEASSGVEVDLTRRLNYLTGYPHGCSEQVTSGALPQLYLDNFAELSPEQRTKVQANITYAMNELYSRQLASGGMAYWPGNTYAEPWVSSYVGQFMFEAKAKGYSVMPSFVSGWLTYQKGLATQWPGNSNDKDQYNQMNQAYRLFTLALWGSPEMGAMNRLKDNDKLYPQARWNLALAYLSAGKKDVASQLIFNQQEVFTPYSPFNPTFGSTERDQAMVLQFWTAMGREDEAMKWARKVSASLNGSGEPGTQALATQLMALAKFSALLPGKTVKINVEQSGAKSLTLQSKDRPMVRCELPTTPAAGKVALTNSGSGKLFVTLTSRSIPFVDNSPAIARGISLRVNYLNSDGAPIAVEQIPQGTDFVADVVVSSTSPATTYTNLALVETFASGWEILNERMMTAQSASTPGETPSGVSYQDVRDDRVMSYFDLAPMHSIRIQVRLRASYKGRFYLPAYSCRAMYDDSVEARTTGSWVEVN